MSRSRSPARTVSVQSSSDLSGHGPGSDRSAQYDYDDYSEYATSSSHSSLGSAGSDDDTNSRLPSDFPTLLRSGTSLLTAPVSHFDIETSAQRQRGALPEETTFRAEGPEPEWVESSDSAEDPTIVPLPAPVTRDFVARVRLGDWYEEAGRRMPPLMDSSDDEGRGVLLFTNHVAFGGAISSDAEIDSQRLADPVVAPGTRTFVSVEHRFSYITRIRLAQQAEASTRPPMSRRRRLRGRGGN